MHNLRSLRESKVGSRDKLARLTGLTVTTIARLERGDQRPSLATAALLAQALGVNVAEFVESEEAAG